MTRSCRDGQSSRSKASQLQLNEHTLHAYPVFYMYSHISHKMKSSSSPVQIDLLILCYITLLLRFVSFPYKFFCFGFKPQSVKCRQHVTVNQHLNCDANITCIDIYLPVFVSYKTTNSYCWSPPHCSGVGADSPHTEAAFNTHSITVLVCVPLCVDGRAVC